MECTRHKGFELPTTVKLCSGCDRPTDEITEHGPCRVCGATYDADGHEIVPASFQPSEQADQPLTGKP